MYLKKMDELIECSSNRECYEIHLSKIIKHLNLIRPIPDKFRRDLLVISNFVLLLIKDKDYLFLYDVLEKYPELINREMVNIFEKSRGKGKFLVQKPLECAIRMKSSSDVFWTLFRHGANAKILDIDHKEAIFLHLAKYDDSIFSLRKIIESGVNINTESKTGMTALNYADECGSYRTFEFLLKSGVDYKKGTSFSEEGRSRVLNYLMRKGRKLTIREYRLKKSSLLEGRGI